LRQQPVAQPLSDAELAFVAALKSAQLQVGAHEPVALSDGNGDCLYTLLSGWAYRYKRLPSGKRQVLDFLLPGDLIGLHSRMTAGALHEVRAITPVSLCLLDVRMFDRMVGEQPALLSAVIEMLLAERERADTHQLLLGRLRPTEGLACLLLELRWRLRRRGLIDDERCEFPLTYELLADASGMSRSQLAQSLVELRERGWATIQHGWLQFHAPTRMAEACGYVEPRADARQMIL
jgi:CRP-like cAMP-binding protein